LRLRHQQHRAISPFTERKKESAIGLFFPARSIEGGPLDFLRNRKEEARSPAISGIHRFDDPYYPKPLARGGREKGGKKKGKKESRHSSSRNLYSLDTCRTSPPFRGGGPGKNEEERRGQGVLLIARPSFPLKLDERGEEEIRKAAYSPLNFFITPLEERVPRLRLEKGEKERKGKREGGIGRVGIFPLSLTDVVEEGDLRLVGLCSEREERRRRRARCTATPTIAPGFVLPELSKEGRGGEGRSPVLSPFPSHPRDPAAGALRRPAAGAAWGGKNRKREKETSHQCRSDIPRDPSLLEGKGREGGPLLRGSFLYKYYLT